MLVLEENVSECFQYLHTLYTLHMKNAFSCIEICIFTKLYYTDRKIYPFVLKKCFPCGNTWSYHQVNYTLMYIPIVEIFEVPGLYVLEYMYFDIGVSDIHLFISRRSNVDFTSNINIHHSNSTLTHIYIYSTL